MKSNQITETTAKTKINLLYNKSDMQIDEQIHCCVVRYLVVKLAQWQRGNEAANIWMCNGFIKLAAL